MLVNQINPQKLLNSKWTAIRPENNEKHFIVTKIQFDEQGIVTVCSIESVLSKRMMSLCGRDLKDQNAWAHGWI